MQRKSKSTSQQKPSSLRESLKSVAGDASEGGIVNGRAEDDGCAAEKGNSTADVAGDAEGMVDGNASAVDGTIGTVATSLRALTVQEGASATEVASRIPATTDRSAAANVPMPTAVNDAATSAAATNYDGNPSGVNSPPSSDTLPPSPPSTAEPPMQPPTESAESITPPRTTGTGTAPARSAAPPIPAGAAATTPRGRNRTKALPLPKPRVSTAAAAAAAEEEEAPSTNLHLSKGTLADIAGAYRKTFEAMSTTTHTCRHEGQIAVKLLEG